MQNHIQNEMSELIDQAIAGDKKALENLLMGVQDIIFNLSLRMLGSVQDAEDATQEIVIKVMTHLTTFRKESAFSTWVFRIASNHLQNYKKNIFSKYPLSFEFYGDDIANGKTEDIPDLSQGVENAILAEELKLSCTNVMLQCLDGESRCIFILGTMFKVDSRIAGDILGISAEVYRQRLSRIRKKMAEFLDEYCGLSKKGSCQCNKRVNYAIANHRINPKNLEFTGMEQDKMDIMLEFKSAMEETDNLSMIFNNFPTYRSTPKAKDFLLKFLQSDHFTTIQNL